MRKRTGQFKNCENCGKETYVPESKLDRNNHFYCSHKCYTTHREYGVPVNSTIEEVPCVYCGNIVRVAKWQRERYPHSFCSRSCSSAWQKENLVGSNSPFWKGGSTYRVGAKRWQEQRLRVRERDNFTCQECRKIEDGDKRAFDVHHVDTAVEDPDFNKDYNCETLCRKCHARRHTANRSNSGEPQTGNAVGNPERRLRKE